MFKVGVVLHYVSEYSQFERDSLEAILSVASTNNILVPEISSDISLLNIIENLPIGTIICKTLNEDNLEENVICLPMFSSHVSMPIKINEVVWFMEDQFLPYEDFIEENAPLLSIRNYWLSRKIGFKISEDLNFSNFHRDANITSSFINDVEKIDSLLLENNDSNTKKELSELKKEVQNNIRIPEFKNHSLYQELFSNILEDNEISYDNEKFRTFFPSAVPRWSSKPYELTLQGSNNSLINLTNVYNQETSYVNKGAVDIVSGRLLINNYIERSDFNTIELKDKIIENLPDEISSEDFNTEKNTINLKNDCFPKILNSQGHEETLKSQKYYLNFNDNEIDETNEGKSSLEYDASRIYVAEFDDLDNSDFYDTAWIDFQEMLSYSDSESLKDFELSDVIEDERGFLQDEEKIVRQNFKIDFLNNFKTVLPSILVKSNDIRIVARKKYQNEKDINGEITDNILDEGSIRLIKESNEFSNYSHICMENNGQILVDGQSILLGNFKKEAIKLGVISDIEDEEFPDDIASFEQMKGKGSGLLIGYNEKLSEPLVLGNTLESMLKELIHINIALVDELNKISNNILKHTHSGVTSGPGLTTPPVVPQVSDVNSFVMSEKSNIELRYENLKSNLNKMLSRFAKTT
jgi:hypothetical protein